MDTRTKICDNLVEALDRAGPEPVLVAGYFDPLTAEHARRLAELASGSRPLVALVESPPDALLDARARAELIAGLAVVRTVVIGTPDTRGVVGSFKFVRDHDLHLRIRADLMDHVRRRHT